MSTWNMPPGVSTNDIPGNRPEDIKEEAFWESLDEKIHEISSERDKEIMKFLTNDVEYRKVFFRYAELARDMAYRDGYDEGQRDATEAYYYEQHKGSLDE